MRRSREREQAFILFELLLKAYGLRDDCLLKTRLYLLNQQAACLTSTSPLASTAADEDDAAVRLRGA